MSKGPTGGEILFLVLLAFVIGATIATIAGHR